MDEMNDSLAMCCRISSPDAHSKNNSTAFFRFALASSTVPPWEATSSSGHNATNPSSSRVRIAVSVCFMGKLMPAGGGSGQAG